MKLGPTNTYPQGKLQEDDKGALRCSIGTDKGVVKIIFGVPTDWIGLPKREAIDFAQTILKHARKLP